MFPHISTIIKTWEESFSQDWKILNIKVKNFWGRWFSQLATNNLRWILAEYIVASDLGIVHNLREERDAYDLITPEKIKIEIKSASYIQSWEQKKLSTISFSIRPTHGYDIKTTKRNNILKRQSDVYVFCLLAHKDQNTLNPLDMGQRDFYIITTRLLDQEVLTQKSITLKKLQRIWAKKIQYWKIYETIKTLLI